MQPDSRFLQPAYGVALALLGIYAVTVLAAALPLQLLQPSWIERICGSLRGGVSFPLIALVLLLVADLDTVSPVESRQLTLIRRWASFAALGFVLMIPLQTWAGIAVVQQFTANEKSELLPYTRALAAIRIADSEEALIRALASIPGTPANIGGRLKEPLPQVRRQLLSQIEPQLNARQLQFKALQSERLQQGLLRWIKDAFVALFAAAGFAAAGRRAPDRPTLLEGLLFSERRRVSALAPNVQARTGDAGQDEEESFDENQLYP